MRLMKTVPFEFEGIRYEIRILSDGNTINVAAFRDNHPVNGFRRRIILQKTADPERLLETDVLKNIVETSKHDITERLWEKCETALIAS